MKKALTKVMLVAIMAILPLSFYAQKNQTKPVEKYFYISAEGGLSINHTDVANYGFVPFYQDLNNTGKQAFVFNDGYVFKNFNGKLGLGYQLGKVIGVNAKFGYATLGGKKYGQNLMGFATTGTTATAAKYKDVEMNKTNLLEGNLNLTFNFMNLFFGYNPRRVFSFIPHIGVGAIGFQSGEITKLSDGSQIFASKTGRQWAVAIPLGAELNFNLARKLDLFIDYTYNLTLTDEIDQLQKTNEFDKPLINKLVNKNDMYSALNLGLRYKFNKKPCDIETMAANAGQITMRTNPSPIEEKDGQVCFDVIFNVPAEYFEKDAVMNIAPVMTYKGGQVALDPVTFVGQNVNNGNADFKVNYKTGGEFTKNYCMDFVPEMESGKITGTPMFYVYDGKIYGTQDEIVKNVYFTQGNERVIADGVKYVKPVVIVDNPVDTVEVVEPVVVEPDFIFYYDYNSSVLRQNTKLNKAAFKAMAEKLAAGNTITGFEIQGWASPEGELELNNNLANDRAAAGDKAIKSQLRKVKLNEKDFNFVVNGNGPDWDKFIELVQNSNIAEKDQIVRVIKNSKNREQEIKNMINVYPELERDILPLLRRAEVYIK